MEKEIIWTSTSRIQLEDIYFYLLEETKKYTIADKVIDSIIDSVKILETSCDISKMMK